MRTKRLDNSHLTDKEKRHSVSLIILAISTGILGYFIASFTKLILIEAFTTGAAIAIIAFVWGYIGATESERSGR